MHTPPLFLRRAGVVTWLWLALAAPLAQAAVPEAASAPADNVSTFEQLQSQQRATPRATDPQAAARNAVAERQMDLMLTTLEAAVQRNDFIEKVFGLPPSATQFEALRSGLGAIYSDRILMRSLLANIDVDDPNWEVGFRRNWGTRMASGMGRMSDESAMKLLRPMATTLGNFSREQCSNYVSAQKQSSPKNVFSGMLLPAMDASDVLQLLDGFHDALMADLSALPLRPLPNATELTDLTTQLNRLLPAQKAGAEPPTQCEALTAVVRAIEHMEQPHRSLSITYLMTIAGFYTQKASNAPR